MEKVYAEELAYQAFQPSSYIYIEDGYDLMSGFDLEKELIKKDLFDKLSDKSKQILNILFYSDDDILKMLSTPKTGNITKRSLMIFLQEIGFSVFNISKCFKELKMLANSL